MIESHPIHCPKCRREYLRPAARIICICGWAFIAAHFMTSAGAAEPPPMAALALGTATSAGDVTQYFIDATTDDVREAPGAGFNASQKRGAALILLEIGGRLYEPAGEVWRGWPSAKRPTAVKKTES